MICFYHNKDLDGHCSGAIIKYKHPKCKMIGVDYTSKLNRNIIQRDEVVFVVDYRFSKDDMEYLNKVADLIWIDHHKSSVELAETFTANDIQIIEIGTAGCELTWKYMYPISEMPRTVYWLGRYDVWDHKDSNVLPFQYGMKMKPNTLPGSDIWSELFDESELMTSSILDTGCIILEYEKVQNEKYMSKLAFECEFQGYNVIAVNKGCTNSMALDSVYDNNKHDLRMWFEWTGTQFKYTISSTKIDVSQIAKKYGGGGHIGVAGFHHKELLLKRKK